MLLRLGLVSFVVAQVAYYMYLRFPITFDTSAWYFGMGLTGLFAVAALTLYGFRTSLGGRPALGTAALDE